MQKYREYKPTMFDPVGLNLEDRQDWVVCATGHNRDSELWKHSNFDAAISILGGESDTVEIHRFSHWSCGWLEIILVHPSRDSEVSAIEERLDNCSLLDEEDYSNRQWESAYALWDRLPLQQRIALCGKENISIFAARHARIPADIDIDILAGE